MRWDIRSSVLWAGLLLPISAWAGEGAVLMKAETLRAQPYRDAKVLAELAPGQDLEILQQEGGWYRVRSGRQTGWVRMLSVRRGGPRQGTPLAGLAALASGRAGSGQVVATTGVRGLLEETLQSARFDEAALAQMEGYRVSAEEARRFAAQAGLTPVAVQHLPEPEGGER